MNKKNIIIFFCLFLGIAFAFVSLMVIINKGKSKTWISYKLKIGGLLLTIIAVSESCRLRNATCYATMPDRSTKEIVGGISTGRELENFQNRNYSIKAGFGTWKYPPRKYGYEFGLNAVNNNYYHHNLYSLGPYIGGSYRIGYLTDIFIETGYNYSLNKRNFGDNINICTGISYPALFHSPIGVKIYGDFIYSNYSQNITLYPSIKLYMSIPVRLKSKATRNSDF